MTQWLLYVQSARTLTDSALSLRVFLFHMNFRTDGDFLPVRHPPTGPSKRKRNVSCSDYQFDLHTQYGLSLVRKDLRRSSALRG